MFFPYQPKHRQSLLLSILVLLLLFLVANQVGSADFQHSAATNAPGIVSYQGKVTVSGKPFDGSGHFKFAVVNGPGDTVYWSNDGTATGEKPPSSEVVLNVRQGIFTVLLGDTSLNGMTQPLSADAFSTSERFLRVWFSHDGINYNQLTPDQRIAAVPFALVAQEAVSAGNADTIDGQHATELALPSGVMLLGAPGDTRLTDAGYQHIGLTNFTANGYSGSWFSVSTTNAPVGRYEHSVVWTGNEMIVWGGENYQIIGGGRLNTGGRYNPFNDTWIPTSITNAPEKRMAHTVVWTGSEMIVWGGWNEKSLDSGARYDPTTDTWIPVSMTNAPTARTGHEAVWTGSEMIVWGGNNDTGFLNTGGRYNPLTDTWTPIATTDAPTGRRFSSMVWTGSEVIIWGGEGRNGYLNTGAGYNPSTDIWTPISSLGAPASRSIHTTVWAGSEMVVWGGQGYGGRLNSGGRYSPSTDSWITISSTNAPVGRDWHSAVWTGTDMIVWGGWSTSAINTGGRYNLSTDMWTILPNTNSPESRSTHTAVWTGNEMIIWGSGSNTGFINSGGRYTALLSLYQKP